MRELTLQRRLLGGLRLTAHKRIATAEPIQRGFLPSQLILPLNLPRGDLATPCVSIGDEVLRGQPVAIATSEVIHASTSGRVCAIESHPISGPPGATSASVVIRCDGEDRALPGQPLDVGNLDRKAALEHIRAAGVVGLGGAVYATADKLAADAQQMTLVLNGAECEPYISCDDMLMREQASQIVDGAMLMCDLTGAKRCIVAIERDKPDAVGAISQALASLNDQRFELAQVPTVYPAGGERQLIQLLTGIEVPTGRYPTDAGFICHNVATAVAVSAALRRGEPLTRRIVTVTGQGVQQPKNIEAPIGTQIAELIEQAGGYNPPVSHLIMGGSMMGIALETDAVTVTKATNCIIAARPDELYRQDTERPCIRCGDCAQVCPARLLPQELIRSLHRQDLDAAADLALLDCIECGCCDVVCPSHIPLTEGFRAGKHALALLGGERAAAERAEQRVDARSERLRQATAAADKERQNLQAAVRGDKQSRQAAVQAVLDQAHKPQTNRPGDES